MQGPEKRAETIIGKVVPPLEWFTGFTELNDADEEIIFTVMTSRSFYELEDGKVAKAFVTWCCLAHPERKDKQVIAFEEKAIKDTHDYVLERTGFSPQEIDEYLNELRETYMGEKVALFKIGIHADRHPIWIKTSNPQLFVNKNNSDPSTSTVNTDGHPEFTTTQLMEQH